MSKRTTSVRVAHTGKGEYQWLTKKEFEIAEALNVTYHPTIHRAEGEDIGVECPTPHVCGYFISLEDWKRIEAIKELMRKP